MGRPQVDGERDEGDVEMMKSIDTDKLEALAKEIETSLKRDEVSPRRNGYNWVPMKLRALIADALEEGRADPDRTVTIYEAGSHHAIATVPYDPAMDRETISGGPVEAEAKAEEATKEKRWY